MLYELITGHRPFRGVTIDELRRAQRTSRPIVPSTFSEKEVPPLLDRVTMECLSLKADERPSFATMAQELKWAYDNEIGSEGPERSDRRWALLERAVALNNQRQPGAALAILKEVADEDPRDFNAWHLMGNALMQIGESQMPMDTAGEETRSLHDATASYRSAIWCAERSTELNPEHAWAWNTQGACLMSIGYFHRALCRLDRAIEIDPSYAIAWRTRGICLRRMGRLSDALESFDHALALEPHNANGLNGKGVCLGLLDLYPEALACFDEALRLVPNHIQALANRTLWEDLAAGDGDKIAITVSAYNPDVDEYLHRKLNIPDANRKGGRTARDLESAELADRAWGLMNVGLLNEAEKVIAEAIAIDSKYSTAWLQRGKILRRMGRIGEAIAAFEKTREIDPQYSLALLNEGLAHLDVGRLDHALELFKKYIAAEPNDSVGWNNRGLVFVKQQKYQDAIRSFAQSVRVDPTFSLGWFNKAQAHLSAGEIDSAYECCKQGLHLDPLNLGGLLVLGQTELKSGRLEAALAAFRGVTELDSSMANGWAHRALVESSYEAVMSCCQRAQELGFQDEELLLVAQGRGCIQPIGKNEPTGTSIRRTESCLRMAIANTSGIGFPRC
jgi:tetratricopeptide (TPR) repeat protein